jgi:putative chitinase
MMRDWSAILSRCGVRSETADAWGPVFADTIKDDTFSSPADLPDFLGQILVESAMLEKMEENLNYSAERLCAVWPGRFPTVEVALPYIHNPEALANRVYGGRMGNVDPGDGWRYRGRGILQVTGRRNYQLVGTIIGQDLEDLPELLEQPHFALAAAIAWWEKKVPDAFLGDVSRITTIVNGGANGIQDRERLTSLARVALGSTA